MSLRTLEWMIDYIDGFSLPLGVAIAIIIELSRRRGARKKKANSNDLNAT
jgi:hypothetical protein